MIHLLQLGQTGRLFAPTDPLRANVVLLLDMESGEDEATTFTDRSQAARAVSVVGTAQIDKSNAKFGSRSLLVNGSGDALTLADSSAFTLGTSDFCFETCVRFASLAGQQLFAGQCNSAAAATTASFGLQKRITDDKIVASVFSGSTDIAPLVSSVAVALATWYHVALQRSGTSFALHVDGVLEASASSASSINDSSNLWAIGRLGEYTPNSLIGSMDEVRFTVGATRYPIGANFTPPNKAHPLR